jgi:nicotinamidase-related amidase
MSKDTALVVIDAQESFRHRPYWDEADLPNYLQRQQALVDGAVAQGIPVVQVFHLAQSGPFAPDSGYIRTLEPLKISPTATFRKYAHSALVGSGLDVWLIRHGIRRLIISGIRTEQCCETTTRHASDLGFQVDYVTEATLTFPMAAAGGRVFTSSEIKARTELVLAERFARIASVEDALTTRARRAAA